MIVFIMMLVKTLIKNEVNDVFIYRVPVVGFLEVQAVLQQFHSTQKITLAICQGRIIFIVIIVIIVILDTIVIIGIIVIKSG